jgi:hypothetical protein
MTCRSGSSWYAIALFRCRVIVFTFYFLADLRLQCYSYVRLSIHSDTSHYACPLDICVEILGDLNIKRVLSVPFGENNRVGPVSEARVKPFDWGKIHTSSEYHPDHAPERLTTNKPTRRVSPSRCNILWP